MASLNSLPTPLKFVQSTLLRGKELEKREPVISYYCKLHAVQQILGKNLHQSDNEVAEFSSHLLDEVEQFKNNELAKEEYQSIINDEQTAHAYLENFALKVFSKADNEVREKRVTTQTSTTFIAAATFLDTLKVFQAPLEDHVLEKIKYAKFHAARIMKAYKNGENPNDYELPEEEQLQQQEQPLEDEYKTVEVLDGQDAVNETIQPAQPSSFLDADEYNNDDDDNSGENPPPTTADDLPKAPPVLPKAPADAPVGKHGMSLPTAPSIPPPQEEEEEQPQQQTPPPPAPQKPPPSQQRAAASQNITKADVDSIMQQTNTISEAQKRAKFAISALNYEDIETAKSELQQALAMLNNYKL